MKLTPCEYDVVVLAATTDLQYKEIAVKLNKSHKTVDQQIGSALRKLGISSRLSLILRWPTLRGECAPQNRSDAQ